MLDPRLLLIFLFGLIGGGIAYVIGAPMPFMLGGIVGAASFVLWYERGDERLPKMSKWIRLFFMAIIGTMIGSGFTPELLPLLPLFWVSALALIPYIVIAHLGNFTIMRRVGGYAKLDAYYAALPGGIVDSAALAEEAGADLRVVTSQHFIRIILVVTSIPLLFLLFDGNAVGSLAGESLSAEAYALKDIGLILGIALVGLVVGRQTPLPISHMLVPLIIAIGLSVTGVISIDIPSWMGHLAQYMIGTSLGAQFSGVSRALLVRGLRMGVLSWAYMLMLAAGFAYLVTPYVPVEFRAMFISFTSGGMAEMSLIALSLNISPVVVALHHLIRISITVWIGIFSRSVYKLDQP